MNASADTPRPLALVTGGSNGLGLELAKLLANDGYDLVIVARGKDRLDRAATELRGLATISVETLVSDIGAPGSVEELADHVNALGRPLDVLVNNAGFSVYGEFVETSADEELSMLNVNVVALTHLTKLLLPAMVQRRSGRILNLGSTAAFVPGPLMAVYYASKAYVLSFSLAIADELKGTGITVTALCPGPTQTGFQQRAGMEASKLVSGQAVDDPRAVAEIGYRGMQAGKTVVIPNWRNRIQAESARLLPRTLAASLVHRMQARMD